MPFRDIRCNRGSRAANLRCHSVKLVPWELTRQPVALLGKAHGLLPDLKVPVRLNGGTAHVAFYSLFPTSYFLPFSLIQSSKFTSAQICFCRSRTPSKCSRTKFSMFAALK